MTKAVVIECHLCHRRDVFINSDRHRKRAERTDKGDSGSSNKICVAGLNRSLERTTPPATVKQTFRLRKARGLGKFDQRLRSWWSGKGLDLPAPIKMTDEPSMVASDECAIGRLVKITQHLVSVSQRHGPEPQIGAHTNLLIGRV